MTETFGEAWPPMSVPDLATDDDDEDDSLSSFMNTVYRQTNYNSFTTF